MTENKIPFANTAEIKFFSSLAVALAFLLGASFMLEAGVKEGEAAREIVFKSFPEVTLQAQAAYVYDARTDTVLFAQNENKRLPLASLTKLMAALVAYDALPKEGTVRVDREALRATGDSGLMAGERWTLKDLLDFSLISSSNDGMRAVALTLGAVHKSNATVEEIMNDFVSKMNEKASELGLKNTYYFNETGLDEDEAKNGAYGSARDMAMLMDYVLTYKRGLVESTKLEKSSFVSLDAFEHVAPNTNKITNEIPGLLASKTGFTDLAGGNLVVAFDPEIGRPIIVAVLGSTEEGRFKDVGALVQASMEYIGQSSLDKR